jgi:hypothetical protein
MIIDYKIYTRLELFSHMQQNSWAGIEAKIQEQGQALTVV